MTLESSNDASNLERFHIVAQQESLSSIAKLYGLSAKQLQVWNELSESALLFPGMKISLENTRGVSSDTSALTVIHAQVAPIPTDREKPCLVHGFHRIREGESIAKISAVYGIPTHLLLESNQLNWDSPVFIGQKIVLPGVHAMHNCPDFKPLLPEFRALAEAVFRLAKTKLIADEKVVNALSRIYEMPADAKSDPVTYIAEYFQSTPNLEFIVSAWVWFEQLKVELPNG